jgi:hypothetical protein
MNKRLWFVALAMLLTSATQASQFHGPIQTLDLRFSTSHQSPVRVGISTHHPTDCSGFGGGWYADENAGSGIGRLWTDALMQAKMYKHQVTIVGNGVCDVYGIEGISYIDVH